MKNWRGEKDEEADDRAGGGFGCGGGVGGERGQPEGEGRNLLRPYKGGKQHREISPRRRNDGSRIRGGRRNKSPTLTNQGLGTRRWRPKGTPLHRWRDELAATRTCRQIQNRRGGVCC